MPELAHPHVIFTNAGATVTIASPKGGTTYVAGDSVKMYADDEISTKFLAEKEDVWHNTAEIESFVGKASEFDAVFVPGGIGPMFDLVNHAPSQKLVAEFFEAGKVVSAVCHGQAAFLNVKLSDGSLLLSDKNVTAFPESDEDLMGSTNLVPFRLESSIKKITGGRFQTADEPLGEKVVVDGKLVTGQNPASAMKLAKVVLELIG